MIGVLSGRVLFSDGQETILNTTSGIGYQTYCQYILPEGELASLFISHIIRETAEDLYAFRNLREKKLFELLITVKGVGPKSAFNMVSAISVDEIVMAIQSDQKKVLTRVTGIGAKAASQIILDLQSKIQRIRMYTSENLSKIQVMAENLPISPALNHMDFQEAGTTDSIQPENTESNSSIPDSLKATESSSDKPEFSVQSILDDTLLACQNLGFHNDRIVPLAQKILREHDIKKPEQLVHLVLKEI